MARGRGQRGRRSRGRGGRISSTNRSGTGARSRESSQESSQANNSGSERSTSASNSSSRGRGRSFRLRRRVRGRGAARGFRAIGSFPQRGTFRRQFISTSNPNPFAPRSSGSSYSSFMSNMSSRPGTSGGLTRGRPNGSSPGGGSSPNDSQDNVCPICGTQVTNLCITNCNHRFCLDCIRRWTSTNATCPTCRATIHTIRNILPNGGTEIIQISRAELIAHKINEIHSILMILFTVMSHTLLPEVVNYLDQLNEIARELNVPTTSTRVENADATAAETASTSRASSRSSSISSSRASSSPEVSSIFSPLQVRIGSSPQTRTGASSSRIIRMPTTSTRPENANSIATESRASSLSALSSGISRMRSGTGSQARTGSNLSLSPSLTRSENTNQAATEVANTSRASTLHTVSSGTSPSQVRASTASQTRPETNLRGSVVSTTTPTRADNANPTAAGTASASRASSSPAVISTQERASTATQTTNETSSPGEQRARDIRFLTDSYNKINQVYEVLMIMHMVIHRNQVELDPPSPRRSNFNSNDSSNNNQ